MINFIQQSAEELTLTSTSITFGYGPGQTAPPNTLILWSASTGTVTLPPINTVLPTSPGNNYVPGSQALKITIKSLTGQVVNISAASGETLAGSTIVISSTNAMASLIASTTDSKWYAL